MLKPRARHVVASENIETGVAGSGNVFQDLGIGNHQEEQLKADLAFCLNELISTAGVSQTEIAHQLGATQPKVSALRNYRLRGFSAERLMQYLTRLGCDLEVRIGPTRIGKEGGISVRPWRVSTDFASTTEIRIQPVMGVTSGRVALNLNSTVTDRSVVEMTAAKGF